MNGPYLRRYTEYLLVGTGFAGWPRKGKKRAPVLAVVHTILVIVFHMLKNQRAIAISGQATSTDVTPSNSSGLWFADWTPRCSGIDSFDSSRTSGTSTSLRHIFEGEPEQGGHIVPTQFLRTTRLRSVLFDRLLPCAEPVVGSAEY